MKKFLAVILCLAVIFSQAITFVSYADEVKDTATAAASNGNKFSDVTDGNKYKEAIETLADYKILVGDEGATTFRPEGSITRAEFSVIVARLKGMGALAVTPDNTLFTDVNTTLCDEWKVKAVKIAYDLRVVKGYPDGTFKPDAPVTYEEAVKMLVCMLGYERVAVSNGGYPMGYIVTASNIKLSDKVTVASQSDPAARQIVAQLAYNSLTIKKMGSDDSTGTGGSTILDETLKYKKGQGVVKAIPTMSVNDDDSVLKEGQVIIGKTVYNAGSTKAADYFGKEIEFSYTEDGNTYTLVSVTETKSNKEKTFNADKVGKMTENEVRIYTDEDKSDYDIYNFDTNVVLIYNGKVAPLKGQTEDYINSTYVPYDGEIKLIDNTGDNKFDIVIIKDQRPFVISAIDTTKSIIYNEYDSSDTLDLSSGSSKIVTIKKNGSTISFSGLSKGNVLLVSQSLNATGKKYINIEVVTKTVTGKINAMNSQEKAVSIDSKPYDIEDFCWSKYESKFIMDNTVTVYLDGKGDIIYVTASEKAATNYTYGYLVSAGKEQGGVDEDTLRIKVFTTEMQTLKVASKVKINGTQCNDVDKAIAALNSTARTDINKDEGVANLRNATQFIKFAINSSKEVSEILTSVPESKDLSITNNLLIKGETTKAAYRSTKMLGTVAVNASTKVFFVPSDRSVNDDYSVGTISALTVDRSYSFEAYDLSSGVAKAIVVFGDTGVEVYDLSTPMAVVEKITEKSENGTAINEISCYVSGTKVTYKTENLDVLKDGEVAIGDLIKVKRNKKGIVTEVMKLYSPSTGFLYTYKNGAQRFAATTLSDIRNASASGSAADDFCIMYGTVAQKYDERMFVSLKDVENGTLDETNLQPVTFSSSTKYYKYSLSNKKLETALAADLMSFEDAKEGASKVYVSIYRNTPRIIIMVVE